MIIKSMNTPRTRAEFERNFQLLHRQIADRKFHVLPGLSRSIDGIAQVRSLPNGRIDFLSVDESARLQANMLNQSSEDSFLEQLKAQSPPNISADGPDGDASPPVPA